MKKCRAARGLGANVATIGALYGVAHGSIVSLCGSLFFLSPSLGSVGRDKRVATVLLHFVGALAGVIVDFRVIETVEKDSFVHVSGVIASSDPGSWTSSEDPSRKYKCTAAMTQKFTPEKSLSASQLPVSYV